MEKQPATVLALGMTPSEFVREIDPVTWQIYDSGIRQFVDACGGVFSASGSTAAQQQFQRQYISAQRKLIPMGIARLSAEPNLVSGVMQGAADRVVIDTDVVLSLTSWELRLGRLWAPHGRSFDHVRIQPLREARSARGTKRTYDWSQLRSRLVEEIEQTQFKSPAELVRWCRANVVLCESGKRPPKSPDDATTRAAIIKYGLDKLAKIEMSSSGKRVSGTT